mmetsp:Transcript_21002/g.67679  ORF Transcript_21002/g.67679 Transcript_21002/m.67679 type:complete len:207 (+) Transcript_21002:690-1310(+)
MRSPTRMRPLSCAACAVPSERSANAFTKRAPPSTGSLSSEMPREPSPNSTSNSPSPSRSLLLPVADASRSGSSSSTTCSRSRSSRSTRVPATERIMGQYGRACPLTRSSSVAMLPANESRTDATTYCRTVCENSDASMLYTPDSSVLRTRSRRSSTATRSSASTRRGSGPSAVSRRRSDRSSDTVPPATSASASPRPDMNGKYCCA